MGADGELVQRTEETLGKYDLHDFALYHMLRGGYGPERIFEMARLAWPELEPDYIRTTLTTFYRRFSASSSSAAACRTAPRWARFRFRPGGRRMPSDADPAEFLKFLTLAAGCAEPPPEPKGRPAMRRGRPLMELK